MKGEVFAEDWEDEEDRGEEYICSWLLGDSLDILSFQVEVMLEVLRCVYYTSFDPEPHLVQKVFENPGDIGTVAIRRLVADIKIKRLHVDKSITISDLSRFEDIAGFMTAMMRAFDRWVRMGETMFDWFPEGNGGYARWKDYMVGEGPVKHWVHAL